ncbi:hypothetical protein IFM89_018652 [Coptis chinensis]|uniref:Uncharacterized protein n=1 Tax=Coptis chinensis TaxID=261450 RepID=A0A835LUV4_9MAGN|nr:hypothetical protein IFM89_018652 [Coptis chinensis]
MTTLVIYGVLQEKIMRVPYGEKKEYFKYSLFLVFCNRIMTSAVSTAALLASKKALDPVAPIYKYCLISVSNILTTTCQYEALKYVSFPVQTLAKCAKMIPVMAAADISSYNRGRESTVWGVSLMIGYLGFVTGTLQAGGAWPLAGLNWDFLKGLILQGHLLLAIEFVSRHNDCFFDILLLSTVATASQFFISYTIRTFGALTFATIMITRQLVSIMLSCLWFAHPLSWEQWIGAAIVFSALYAKSFLRSTPQKPPLPEHEQSDSASLLNGNSRLSFKRIIRNKSTEEFSVAPYVAALLNSVLYTLYGSPLASQGWENLPLVTINGTGILMELIFISIYFCMYGSPLVAVSPSFIGVPLGILQLVVYGIYRKNKGRAGEPNKVDTEKNE